MSVVIVIVSKSIETSILEYDEDKDEIYYIIYDTEECGYSEGLDRLVQLYREFRRDRQTKIGDYVDTRIKGTLTRNTNRVLGKHHYNRSNVCRPCVD